MNEGVVYTILSAVLFGINPILARYAMSYGTTSVTMAFFRALFSIPVIALIARARGVRLSCGTGGAVRLFVSGGLLNGVTIILIYSSFDLIPAGMAVTLHYVYPLVSCIIGAAMFGERLGWVKVSAVAVCTAGVALFASGGGAASGVLGPALALASGVTFASYLVFAERSALRHEHYLRITFALNVVLIFLTGAYGAASGKLSLAMDAQAWPYIVMGALLCGVGAVALLQIGVKEVGATTAAVLSTFEPITSVAAGALLLGEEITPARAAGTALVVASVIAVSAADRKR